VENFEIADWKTIFDQYGSKMLLFARQFVPNQADAEDIVQDAFRRYWKSNHLEGENTISLLFGSVRWAALDHIRQNERRRKRETLASQDDRALNDCHMFERSIEKTELSDQVEAALQRLSDSQRQIVVLKVWGEMTYEQIGQTLGISQNTASSRYRYALDALRRVIRKDCYVN